VWALAGASVGSSPGIIRLSSPWTPQTVFIWAAVCDDDDDDGEDIAADATWSEALYLDFFATGFTALASRWDKVGDHVAEWSYDASMCRHFSMARNALSQCPCAPYFRNIIS
jgi:hypothetical protein